MSKLKIAVMIDWYLPGTKAGGPVRSVYSLISLLKNHFDFYLITTNQDLGCTKDYEQIEANTFLFKDQVHYYYFSRSQLNAKNMRKVIAEISPALVYLNSFWSFNFSIQLVHLKNKGLIAAPLLLAPRGMLGKGALGLKSIKKRSFLFISRTLGWYDKIKFHATQSQEQSDIRVVFNNAQIAVAPNINAGAVVQNRSEKSSGELKLFFLSRVSEVKNLHFALETLRLIPPQFKVDYTIFGNIENREYWQECEKIIATLPGNIRVAYHGELKFNEVQETICQFHSLFLPTLNENFGHSIIESLLCGCPTIISDQTPWNDLQKNNAGFALPLDNMQAFVDAIVHYAILNQSEFTEVSQAAQQYINSRINTQETIERYKNLFNDSAKN